MTTTGSLPAALWVTSWSAGRNRPAACIPTGRRCPGWHNIGYPIASCRMDGSFVLSKPDNTGGLIVPASVAEQVLYEVGDPAAYILPDVVADFTQVTLEQAGANRVHVSGARGYAPTSQYKVSATYQDGYRGVAVVSIVGPDAVAKAEKTADALLARARMLFRQRQLPDFTATHTEVLGSESAYGPKANARGVREVLMRLVVDHADREAIDIFARELGSVGISFAQGTTGIFSGRPKPVAGGAAVHVFHRQGGAGRAEGADRRGRSVRCRRADAGRLCCAGGKARAGRSGGGRCSSRGDPAIARGRALRRQGQFIEYRDHRARSELRR